MFMFISSRLPVPGRQGGVVQNGAGAAESTQGGLAGMRQLWTSHELSQDQTSTDR